MTANEIINRNLFVTNDGIKDVHDSVESVEKLMIEFARYHVREALEYALDEVPYGGSDEIRYEDVRGILTCYPEENIK